MMLGASLAGLPGNERQGMSWLRRLFSRGGEAARWEKLLAATPGQPQIELIASLLTAQGDDGSLGPLGRVALGFGALSHEILEEKIGLVAPQGPQRGAVERGQARLWLQSAVPQNLEHEWRPVLELVESDANKRALLHIDRALKKVHGAAPGDASLGRWLKGFVAEIGPLAEGRGAGGALPPALVLADHDVRGPHFEAVHFVEKAQAAVSWFVFVANRIVEAFTLTASPDRAAIVEALGGSTAPGARLPEPAAPEIEAARERWRRWMVVVREEAMTRGRNPKPAFAEGETIPEQRLQASTMVLSLADLPPEVDGAVGAPPLPEMSGPVMPPALPGVTTLPPPLGTQEVSLSQIEAEVERAAAQRSGFGSPPMTQEVSVAQIESTLAARSITQPIPAEDVAAANREDAAVVGTGPPPPPLTEPPTPAAEHTAPHESNGANGVGVARTGEVEDDTAAAAVEPTPKEPPRE